MIISYIMIFGAIAFMWMGLMGVMVWYFLFYRFKHYVVFFLPGKQRFAVLIKRARDHYDKKLNIKVWRIRFPKEMPKQIEVPANVRMDFTKKGKFVVYAYLTELGDVVYASPDHPKIVEDFMQRRAGQVSFSQHTSLESKLGGSQMELKQLRFWRKVFAFQFAISCVLMTILSIFILLNQISKFFIVVNMYVNMYVICLGMLLNLAAILNINRKIRMQECHK